MDTLVLVLAAVLLLAVGLPLVVVLRMGRRMRSRLADLPTPEGSGRQIAPADRLLSDDEWADAIRHQRHMWLNHMQVISGWLQLNNLERAEAYIETTMADLQEWGQIMRTASSAMIGLLFKAQMLAERRGIRLSIPLSGDQSVLPYIPPSQFGSVQEMVLEMLKAVENTGERQVQLSLEELAGGVRIRLESQQALTGGADLGRSAASRGMQLRMEPHAWVVDMMRSTAEKVPGEG